MAAGAEAQVMRPARLSHRESWCGGVAEWLKAHAWKACIRETVSRVRIPLSPPPSGEGCSLGAPYQRELPELGKPDCWASELGDQAIATLAFSAAYFL